MRLLLVSFRSNSSINTSQSAGGYPARTPGTLIIYMRTEHSMMLSLVGALPSAAPRCVCPPELNNKLYLSLPSQLLEHPFPPPSRGAATPETPEWTGLADSAANSDAASPPSPPATRVIFYFFRGTYWTTCSTSCCACACVCEAFAMAKSLRAHCKKRARAEMRATVGVRQATKALRKTTRGTLRALVADGASESAMRDMLAGAGGASAHQVTLEPRIKRKLPYTFNQALRESRIRGGVEDETDDEAENVGARNERGDLLRGEPTPTGAATAGMDPVISLPSAGSAAAGETDERAQWGAVLRAFDKPLGKREMSASAYDWAVKDVVNPVVAGFYEVPAGKNKKKRGDRYQGMGVRKDGDSGSFFPKPNTRIR